VSPALREVHPEELAHHLADLSGGVDVLTEEELFRAVLDVLGLKKLTENVKSVLRPALALVSDEGTTP
jgi:hypothetical protein